VEQGFETMWRMARLAGGIDLDRQVHRDSSRYGAHLEVPNYCREGNTNPRSGWAGAVSAGGTPVPQGASFDQRDVQFLENKFIAVQADMNAMLAKLAGALPRIQR
jgi:hypothetical protein